ncbi:MAG: Rieske 2Fe-2S domain-containing protein [Dehalococcoidia bacterium]|nr:Rieske 2Fe-2S domain-containing protein [Dehalococcoidia bacterium]
MLTQEQNDTLCHIGPGTPMGNVMRRYWVPALLSWELAEPDCPPVTIKLLGEELVAFRQTDGHVGVVGARCAHRRAHLFWGRNEENGIRCVYHGWKFDCEGACVDMPSEPEESNFKDKVRILAYPTYEVGGVIWAYMGPPEKKPPAPLFDWAMMPAPNRAMSKVWQQCNWLQAFEGGVDSVHVNFLHGGRPPGQRYDESDARGRANNRSTAIQSEVMPTDYGFVYAAIRDLGDEGDHVRVYHWVMPWTQIRNLGDSPTISGHMWVPMDDENTMVYNWSTVPPGERAERAVRSGMGGRAMAEVDTDGNRPLWFRDAQMKVGAGNEFAVDVDAFNNFRSINNMDNQYSIDRAVQKTQTYTGIPGTNTQDRAVQESMGAIADRTLERLGTTDRQIINARRAFLKAIKTVEDGGDPPGVSDSYYRLRPTTGLVPKGGSWYEVLKAGLFRPEEEDELLVKTAT